MPRALGLIETKGLVAAIEAADAMVKAANVTFAGKEIVKPAMVTIKVVGDTAAVRSAVDAGAAAAARVGQLISTHIIPQPDEQLVDMLPEIGDRKQAPKTTRRGSQAVKETERKVEKRPDSGGQRKMNVEKAEEVKEKIEKAKPAAKEPEKIVEIVEEEPEEEETERKESPSDTIARLRKEALGLPDDTETSRNVGKEETAGGQSEEGTKEDIESLNVHKLRHLARSIPDFPIKGREISRANRDELLDYFRKLK